MTVLRRLRIFLLGPDKAMLEEPAPAPTPILTDAERARLRHQLQIASVGDEVVCLPRATSRAA